MDTLKKIWGPSFKVSDVASLVITIVFYVVIDIATGIACWLVGLVPFIGGISSWTLGTLVGLYSTVGIVFAILRFIKKV